jgi:hypothetical protein
MLMNDSIPRGHGGKRTGAGRKPKSSSVEPVITEADYNLARARRETALAGIAELDLAKQRRELLPADAVQEHWSTMIANMRQILLTLPSRLAAVVPGCETQQEAEREAMQLVREALTAISKSGVPGQ